MQVVFTFVILINQLLKHDEVESQKQRAPFGNSDIFIGRQIISLFLSKGCELNLPTLRAPKTMTVVSLQYG